jgi:hypothetical protein
MEGESETLGRCAPAFTQTSPFGINYTHLVQKGSSAFSFILEDMYNSWQRQYQGLFELAPPAGGPPEWTASQLDWL